MDIYIFAAKSDSPRDYMQIFQKGLILQINRYRVVLKAA